MKTGKDAFRYESSSDQNALKLLAVCRLLLEVLVVRESGKDVNHFDQNQSINQKYKKYRIT